MKIQKLFHRAGMILAGVLLASLAFGGAAAYALPQSGMDTTASGRDYIFPNSSYELLSDGYFEGMTKEELRIGRNEIYARHGRRFNDAALQRYFDSKPWYRGTIAPEAFDESVFNTWEKRNIRLIMNAEEGPFANYGGVSYSAAQGAPSAEEQVVPLSNEDLQAFTYYLAPYNTFLTCTYDDPTQISWPWVLYNGMDRDIDDSYAVRLNYTAVTGEEPFTDVTAIRKADVEDIVRTTTGTEYSQAQNPLDGSWVWLPGLQAYAFDHGDTNMSGITFNAGEYSGSDLVRLYYYYTDGSYTATLRRNGNNGWWFYSVKKD